MSGQLQDHIRHISLNNQFPPDHIKYLVSLKSSGFEPKVIYDIGSCVLHWTKEAEKLWPLATYILFDAFIEAEFLYREGGYQYHMGVLSDRSGKVVKWYQNNDLFGGNSYYRENNSVYFPPDHFVERTTFSLDDVVREKQFPLPDLVKIDVQGCEKDIVTGGVTSLSQTKHLLIEMQNVEYNLGAPMEAETRPYIEQLLGVKCIAPKFCDNGPDADYGFIRP
jgi:FkbM family methyltransferase